MTTQRVSPRRSVLVRIGLVIALGCVVWFAAGCSDQPSTDQRAPEPPRDDVLHVYGLQLHVHGSLSEGAASMASHDAAAAALSPAVDVLWWTDHSWRLHGYTYVDGFDFEDGLSSTERVPRPPNTRELTRIEGTPARSARPEALDTLEIERHESSRTGWIPRSASRRLKMAKVEVVGERAREGERSLRIETAADGPEWQSAALDFQADRRRQIAPLAAGVKLRLSVWPEASGPNARLVLALALSQQTPDLRGRLEYAMAVPIDGLESLGPIMQDVPGPPGKETTRVVRIPVDLKPGQWNDLEFDVSADAIAHGLGGADNSLGAITLRVDVRRDARALFYVDEFEIVREREGDALFEWAQQRASDLSSDDRVHHVGQEISYAAHLNAYGTDVPLLDPAQNPNGLSASEAVAFAHRHGGLVSLNHLFGVEVTLARSTTPLALERLALRMDQLVADEVYGADLLEVGYRERGRDLSTYLELWDRLSAAGVYVTGVGVSDSHDAREGWVKGPNNFVTWVYARSRSQPDLMEGLRAGRAYFGDPTRFGGRIELAIPGVADMGAVVRRRPEGTVVDARVTGLRAGQRVYWVEDGVRVEAPGENEGVWSGRRSVAGVGIEFIRLEVHDAEGPVALSNPIYWAAEGGSEIPAWRAAQAPGERMSR